MVTHPSRADPSESDQAGVWRGGQEPGVVDASPWPGRWWLPLVAAVGPVVTGYVAVAALLALVTACAPNAEFSTMGVLLAAGPGWLAAHQVPLDIADGRLGMLPLLPTIGMVTLVACTAAGVAGRTSPPSPRRRILLILITAGTHALFGAGLTVAMAGDGSTVRAGLVAGTCYPAMLAGIGALVGLLRRRDPVERTCHPVRSGLRTGLRGLAVLATIGAVTFLAGLAGSLTVAGELLDRSAPEAGSAFGLLLLLSGYLPNAAIGGMSFLIGPGLAVGGYSVAPLRFTAAEVPRVPLLAALPQVQQPWWPALLLVPLVIGGCLGWSLRASGGSLLARMGSVGVAGVTVATGCLVLCAGAGGRLADGPFDPVTMYPWHTAIASLGWTVLPGWAVLGGIVGIAAVRARLRTVEHVAGPQEGVPAHRPDDLTVDGRR